MLDPKGIYGPLLLMVRRSDRSRRCCGDGRGVTFEALGRVAAYKVTKAEWPVAVAMLGEGSPTTGHCLDPRRD